MTIHRCILIPMRDGTKIAADLVLPDEGDGPWPGLVFRTPYGRNGEGQQGFAEAGYCCINCDARGTGASEGDYDYYNMDAGRFDGYDLVEWLASQPFCNGRIGVVGGSAGGIYAICAAAERPPHLQCMSLDVVPMDFYEHQWYIGGVLRTDNRQGWCIGTGNRVGPGAVWDTFPGPQANRAHKAKLYSHRHHRFDHDPLAWADPYFKHQEKNPLWDAIDLGPRLDLVTVPTLFGGVLYDHFGKGTVAAHARFQGPKHLTMQSGPISRPLEQGGWDIPWDEKLAWLDYHLKDSGDCPYGGQHWYITGAEERRHFADQPPTSTQTLALCSDGSWAAAPDGGIIHLAHDPDQPALHNLCDDNAPHFDPVVEQEQFVCIDSQPFSTTTTVLGHPTLRLRLAASHHCAQLTARFCVLEPDGHTRMLNFGARRIFLSEDRRQVLPYTDAVIETELEFWTVAHEFQPGERLRIAISCSESPFFAYPEHGFTVDLHCDGSTIELPVLNS